MPYDVRCSMCGTTQELPNETLTEFPGWVYLLIRRTGESQKHDTTGKVHLCPSCGDGVEDRIVKK